MNPKKTQRAIATGLLLVAFVACWRVAGPRQLGGTSSYVITHGNSMEPVYHEGDLVILRPADSYAKGEIVGYESPSLDRTILHRIHRIDERGFITKGDNNSWLDSDRPKPADVIGAAWLHLPGAGSWLAKARSPLGASLLIALALLSFVFGNKKRSRRARNGKGPQVPRIAFASFTKQQKITVAGVAVLSILLMMLAAVSFGRPTVSAVTEQAAYELTGDFAYSAAVKKNPVYPSGKVETGQPVFLKLVDRLQVTFEYRLRSDDQHSVTGQASMHAVVSGATGWSKTLSLAPPNAFEGDRVRLAGVLDFSAIQKLNEKVQSITGLPESGQTIQLIPRIDVEGDVAGTPIAERFAPKLSFQMDAYQFSVAATGEGAGTGTSGVFRHIQPGDVAVADVRASELRIGGIALDVGSARLTALVALLLTLAVLGGLWMRFSNPAHADEPALIAAQYGEWLIPVQSMQAQSQHKAVQIKSMEALVRLAELYERMILHEDSDGIHSYFVEEEGVVYYYQAVKEQKVAQVAPMAAPAAPEFTHRKTREERRKDEVERLRKELTEIETEVLREKAASPED